MLTSSKVLHQMVPLVYEHLYSLLETHVSLDQGSLLFLKLLLFLIIEIIMNYT